MKGVTDSITRASKAAEVAAKPIEKVGETLDAIKAPAAAAEKATNKVGFSWERAGKVGERFGKSIGKNVIGVLKEVPFYAGLAATAIAGIAAAGASALLAATLYVHGQTQATVAMTQAATAAGVSNREYQRLTFAYGQFNLGADAVDGTMKSLSRNMLQARAGSKQMAAAFSAAGVNLEGGWKSSTAVLAQIADRFARMKDGARKAALAQTLFGDAGVKLIPLLNQGSKGIKALGDEAERLGVVISDKNIKAARAFDDAWQHASNTLTGVRTQIWVGLLPALTPLVQKVDQLLEMNKTKILAGLTDGLNWLTENLPSILDNAGKFINWIVDVGTKTGAFVSAIGGVNTILNILGAILLGKLAWGMIAITAEIWGVNGALYAFPGTWIIAAIAAVIAIVVLMVEHWDWVKKTFVDLWNWMRKYWPHTGTLFDPLIAAAGFIIDHWSSVQAFFQGVGNVFSAVVQGIVAIWNRLPDGLRNFLTGGGKGAQNQLTAFGGGSLSGFGAGNQAVSSPGPINHTGNVSLTMGLPAGMSPQAVSTSPGLDLNFDRGSVIGGH